MKKNLLKTLALLWLAIVLLSAASAWAQPRIYRNNIDSTDPSAENPYVTGEIKDPNVTVSGLIRSTGLVPSTAQASFRATGWNTASLNANNYFEWTITPNDGYALNFTQLNVNQSYQGGQKATALKSSLDNFTATIAETTNNFWNLSGTQYQNVTTPITFRLYVWNAATANNQYGIDFYNFYGTVTPALSTPGFEKSVLKYYPNPVTDILHLNHAIDISAIKIYNMLGQEVLTKNTSGNEAAINMGAFTAGTYLIKVITGNGEKMIKVIKK
jgi:hypothetical protein